MLRKVTVKIGLERIDTQEGITVEALLDSGATRLVMSSEFARKQVLWDALDMNNFYFLFLLFSDFIGILFSFPFLFLLDNEEAHDTAVT